MAATKANSATRSIVVTLQDGIKQRVSNIPANAKITFGPLTPGSRDYSGYGNCLRIYTSQNNQLAVFVNVAHFRDESLAVESQKVVTKAAEESERGPRGAKSKREAEKSYTWESE